MKSQTNILSKLRITIVSVLIVSLTLGTFGFMAYFKSIFASNLIDGVRVVTDSVDARLKTREAEFATRKSNLSSEFQTRLNHDKAILLQSVANPIWNMEKDTALQTMQAFLAKEDISAIHVADEGGLLFSAIEKKDGKQQVVADDKDFAPEGTALSGDVMRADKKIGTVQLYYSDASLKRQLAEVDNDLALFRKENGNLVTSINGSLDRTISEQASVIVYLRLAEMAGCFIIIYVTLTLFIRFGMVKPLGRMLGSMADGSDLIITSASQVAHSAEILADITSKEAASIEETSSTVEEFSSMTKSNALHSRETDKLMADTRKTVSDATGSMSSLFSSIQEIKKSSVETSKIVKTIDEISFQTNILALNAAVEAARAGEHGAGFAVVAEEVRTLAQRAAESAKNTSQLIENTNAQIASAASLVEDTQKRFEAVNELVGKSGSFVTQIAEASGEQARGVEQLNVAIAEIDKTVQQTVASSEESAAASQEMSAQCTQMKHIIENLRSMIGVKHEYMESDRAEEKA